MLPGGRKVAPPGESSAPNFVQGEGTPSVTGGQFMGEPLARPSVRTRLLERIPSSLTLSGDLGKRRSAQRLALDT